MYICTRFQAWIRIVLNEAQLEHYINLLSKDVKQLNNFYLKNAFLRDGERLEALMGYLTALTKLPLNAPINSSFLNTWTPSPLILAGLITGKHQRVTHLASSKRRNASTNSLGQDEAAEDALASLDLHDDTSASESPISPFRKTLLDEDDASSVYSHGSLLDTGLVAVSSSTNLKPTYSPFLSSTPENRTLEESMSKLKFRPPEVEEPLTEVIVNRRKTTRVRRLSKGSGSGENSPRRGSLTQMNIPEIVPMSSSLPTGCGLLSLNSMKEIMKKNVRHDSEPLSLYIHFSNHLLKSPILRAPTHRRLNPPLPKKWRIARCFPSKVPRTTEMKMYFTRVPNPQRFSELSMIPNYVTDPKPNFSEPHFTMNLLLLES